MIFFKGRTHLMLNQNNKAVSSFFDAIALKNDRDYLNGLGFALAKIKKYDQALGAYKKAIILDKKNSFAYFNSGLLFFEARMKVT